MSKTLIIVQLNLMFIYVVLLKIIFDINIIQLPENKQILYAGAAFPLVWVSMVLIGLWNNYIYKFFKRRNQEGDIS